MIEVFQTLVLKSVILKMILLPKLKKKYDECNITLKTIPSDNVNKLIFVHLYINSTRNKSRFLLTQVKDKIDIQMISETKMDESFPKGHFLMKGFGTT